jgi:hypothetical protein
MTWYYKGEEYTQADPQYVGFVYIITNFQNGRKYIGQKTFYSTKKLPPLKGKKNKRHRREDSNWRTYWGSSSALHLDISTQGEKDFHREIIALCVNKNQMNYIEAKAQFDNNVLLSDDYYNGIINCRISSKGLK